MPTASGHSDSTSRFPAIAPPTCQEQGAQVVPVEATEDMQPVIRATHCGQANFIVDLIGYGDTSGTQNLYNEIGNFKGETLLDALPAGPYLLQVLADGPWTIRFRP